LVVGAPLKLERIQDEVTASGAGSDDKELTGEMTNPYDDERDTVRGVDECTTLCTIL